MGVAEAKPAPRLKLSAKARAQRNEDSRNDLDILTSHLVGLGLRSIAAP